MRMAVLTAAFNGDRLKNNAMQAIARMTLILEDPASDNFSLRVDLKFQRT
jgi:hypothetical protein